MERIYLDYNASTPIAPAVKAVVRDLLDREYGDPSALHWVSTGAREIIEAARHDVANLLGSSADEIVLTSGGSESISPITAVRHAGLHLVGASPFILFAAAQPKVRPVR